MKTHLDRFLATGGIDKVRLDVSAGDVAHFLGPPADRSLLEEEGHEIWKYGPLEVTIFNGRVVSLTLTSLAVSDLPKVIDDISVPPPQTTLYQFVADLDEAGVVWEIDSSYSFERQVCIRTGGGVRAFFDLDHREFQSMQVSAR